MSDLDDILHTAQCQKDGYMQLVFSSSVGLSCSFCPSFTWQHLSACVCEVNWTTVYMKLTKQLLTNSLTRLFQLDQLFNLIKIVCIKIVAKSLTKNN